MQSVNTMRAVLVAGAVLAAVVAAIFGLWSVVGIMVAAVVAHGLMWVYLHRLDRPPHS
ncbi:MAG: hypothetical protein H0U48_05810 [Euzebyaceae bacterium]|jgi:hypothetical protein|nr:hypothetical protein [Euzebyaceae bacterium]MDQ3709643.1 hypothetical protein [Actinomycetota bacterium]